MRVWFPGHVSSLTAWIRRLLRLLQLLQLSGTALEKKGGTPREYSTCARLAGNNAAASRRVRC